MQQQFLSLLSADIAGFVQEVEKAAGVEILVEQDASLNGNGPEGAGLVEVVIVRAGATLRVPTNGYFPDGAVLHEALHVRRILVEGVPRLSFNREVDEYGDEQHNFSNGLTVLDNSLEHLAIVPVELERQPTRRGHWQAAMSPKWTSELPALKEGPVQRGWAFVHWALVRSVLADTPEEALAASFLKERKLLEGANEFADRALASLGDKPKLVSACFELFGLRKDWAELEYLNAHEHSSVARPIP